MNLRVPRVLWRDMKGNGSTNYRRYMINKSFDKNKKVLLPAVYLNSIITFVLISIYI